MPTDLDQLVERLRTLDEELADVALDLLRRAVEDGEDDAAGRERLVTRARRAVEKAARLLEEAGPR